MALDFYDFLTHEKLIIFDGGTGTRLIELGLEPGSGNNLANPELVQQVHKEYLEIGSQVITTNTLTANRIYFQSQSEEKLNQLRKINEVGARLAKDLARNDAFVVGDLGPTGQLLEPYGTFTEEEFYKAYLEQARTLAECE